MDADKPSAIDIRRNRQLGEYVIQIESIDFQVRLVCVSSVLPLILIDLKFIADTSLKYNYPSSDPLGFVHFCLTRLYTTTVVFIFFSSRVNITP